MKTVLNISGGLDSTYVLWKLLSTTQEEVTAVFFQSTHIDDDTRKKYNLGGALRDNHFVNDQQNEIIDIIGKWLKSNVRDFNIIKQKIDVSKLTVHEDPTKRNSINTYFTEWAVEQINLNTYDKMVLSYERTNEVYGIQDTPSETALKTGAELCFDIFVSQAKRGQLDFPLLDQENYIQTVALVEMPEELVKLTSSCARMPINPCGECFKCKKRQFFCDQIKENKTHDEVLDIIKSNSMSENGSWVSMKGWLFDQNTADDVIKPVPVWPTSYNKNT